jgi:phosphoribosyl 1,2-cyclic phosphodiesterase
MLEVYPIKSSSKGNCFIVGDGDDMIILDAGITKDEFDFGILKYGDLIDPYKIKGIFITHSHADH